MSPEFRLLAIFPNLAQALEQRFLGLHLNGLADRGMDLRDEGGQFFIRHTFQKPVSEIIEPIRRMVERNHKAGALSVRKFDGILCSPLPGHWLNAVSSFLASSNRPANGINGYGSFSKICDTDVQMLFWRSSVSPKYKPQPGEHLEPYSFIPTSKVERYNDSSECGDTCDPRTNGIPDLNLLIECHGQRPEMANDPLQLRRRDSAEVGWKRLLAHVSSCFRLVCFTPGILTYFKST